ncbi:TetR family transcriptional regulator [Corynebacterium poyangense]|uniref:TetR family transcriptional regulator n=1 Tax=Corynebacterium poyangense TaxID=2684405 RepID=A0A7H0SQR5_9CORY|nr:TetR/AcrR family transcriptional regulator [Corynebacterium poyangense]MBZ8178234.1 TetR family transcriptional regulator [Corynebacterium poyangense]QNQ90890.1 TetR family transcriptional regulator [Corynebacterium poyangense]
MSQIEPRILQPRRRPVQQRSREKYSRLLSAAREVLVEQGFESFTFDEVARRAEVPIGTLYQYFANKYVLICELEREDTGAIIAELQKFSARIPAPQWPELLANFIDHLASVWQADRSRRAVWHAMQSTPTTRATATAIEKPLLEIIANVLRPLLVGNTRIDRQELAGFLVHTVTSLLNYAVGDHRDVQHTVEETKRMLVSYLFAVATAS